MHNTPWTICSPCQVGTVLLDLGDSTGDEVIMRAWHVHRASCRKCDTYITRLQHAY